MRLLAARQEWHTPWPFQAFRLCCRRTARTLLPCLWGLIPLRNGRAQACAIRPLWRRWKKAWTRSSRVKPRVTVNGTSPVPGLGTAGGFKFIIEDRGDLGLEALQKQADAVVQKLREVPGLSNVLTQFRASTPQLRLDIDRTKVAALGLALPDVNQTH